MSHHPSCSLMSLIRLKLKIGWRQYWRCSLPVSVTIERRSCMLQDDFRGLHPLGGMCILPLMPPQTLSPGTSSPPTSEAITYPLESWRSRRRSSFLW
jgi:hypothetical protein